MNVIRGEPPVFHHQLSSSLDNITSICCLSACWHKAQMYTIFASLYFLFCSTLVYVNYGLAAPSTYNN